MVKEEPVSINRQTIYAIIPILDLYAAYKVKRLRKYLLITILVGIGISLVFDAAFPMSDFPMSESEISEEFASEMFSETFIGVLITEIIVQILLAIYLVRRWSKQWNKKFESSSTESA